MKIKPEILTLYRYFAYTAQMRHLYRKEMDKQGQQWLKMMDSDISALLLFLCSAPGLYLMYSYAGIYLVIEGWRDLKLSDQKIDDLLNSPFVDRLRLFRNATFHYQKDLISLKHLQFFGTEEEKTEKWLNKLYSEFERFFRDNTLPIPDKLKESLKNKSHVQIAKVVKDYWNSKLNNKIKDDFTNE